MLKGFDVPIETWEVLGASHAETRFDAAQASNTVALVNRRHEIELMDRLWEEATSSSSRILLLSSEAGIGKSRLAKRLRDRVAAEPSIIMQLQCSPHYQYTAFHPIIRHLERAAGFERDDTTDAKRKNSALLSATTPCQPMNDCSH